MKKLVVPLLFSVLVHLSLITTIPYLSRQEKPQEQKKKPVQVTLIHLPSWNPPKETKKVQPPVVEEDESKKQIVDLPPDEKAKKPKDAKFSSETNHETEKESVSRHRQPTQNPAHELTPGPPGQTGQEGSETAQNHPAQDRQEDRQNDLPEGVGPRKKDKEIQLFPDQETLKKIGSGSGGGAPSNDAIKDVPEGEGTFLNTSAYKYATFFNRVKRDVSQFWRPLPELYRADPTGQKYGQSDRRTLLWITLDDQGNILSVEVVNSSGVEILDNEAVNSFWRCKQFPNPPKGIIENGRVTFHFAFEVSFKRGGIFF